jgi:hypothetical protein
MKPEFRTHGQQTVLHVPFTYWRGQMTPALLSNVGEIQQRTTEGRTKKGRNADISKYVIYGQRFLLDEM